MARKKAKARKTRKKRRSKRSVSVRKKKKSSVIASFDSFLDRTITVRTLLKYTGIFLLFFLVVGSAFMLGRWSGNSDSVTGNPSSDDKISSSATQELDSGSEDSQEDKNTLSSDGSETEAGEMVEVGPEEGATQEVIYRVASEEESDSEEPVQEQYFDSEVEDPVDAEQELEVAEFGFNYSKVEVDVTDLVKRDRGVNWASLESLRLTVKNMEENTIINPTRIKVKMNNKGKGSVWWDDEVFLPESFDDLRPGEQVSEVIPVHVSFSDIYSEKDFRVVVLDDYDVPIAYHKEILVVK